jgi:hypothetical protein
MGAVWLRSLAVVFAAMAVFAAFIGCQRQPPAPKPFRGWGKVITKPSLALHQEQLQKWRSQQPKHYRYKLRYQCYCSYETFYSNTRNLDTKIPRWVILEVLDGQTISAKNIDNTENKQYLEIARHKGVGMVEQGFQLFEQGTEEGYGPDYAIYDEEFGFPRYLAINSARERMHSSYEFEIIEFENLSELDNEGR